MCSSFRRLLPWLPSASGYRSSPLQHYEHLHDLTEPCYIYTSTHSLSVSLSRCLRSFYVLPLLSIYVGSFTSYTLRSHDSAAASLPLQYLIRGMMTIERSQTTCVVPIIIDVNCIQTRPLSLKTTIVSMQTVPASEQRVYKPPAAYVWPPILSTYQLTDICITI